MKKSRGTGEKRAPVHKGNSKRELPHEGINRQTSTPSIYAVVAAHSLSKDIKQKSQRLMTAKRKHGDWGEFDLTHAWSPEDFSSEFGSRHGSILGRESLLADERCTMAQPFVMEPLRTFQVCIEER